jgi:hypothetical protein
MMYSEPARVFPLGLSLPMVQALDMGAKRTVRRLSSSILGRVRSGDLLWVREPIRISEVQTVRDRLYFSYLADPGVQHSIRWVPRIAKPAVGDRPARTMPRELSRFTLRVTVARIERLRSLDASDVASEGLVASGAVDASGGRPVRAYAAMWDEHHLSPADQWAANPEVVVISFALLRQGIDTLVPGLGHGGVR